MGVKDEHDEARDMTLARHVMKVHMNAAADNAVEGELSLAFLKKYLGYCRARCGPRLTGEAAEKLKNRYVVVRISESLAKMALQPFVTDANVEEALRLFQVSTLSAAHSGDLEGAEGFTTEEDQELIHRIEKQLKK